MRPGPRPGAICRGPPTTTDPRARRPPGIERTVAVIQLAFRQGATALAEDLAQLLAAFDSGSESVRERIGAAIERVDQLLALDAARWPRTAGTIDRVRALLGADLTEHAPQTEAWASLRAQLGEAYDALVATLAADATEPRPTSVARVTFHVCSALAGLLATLVVFTTAQLPFAAGTLAAIAWILEILRRRSPAFNARLMGFFGSIARPGEADRINSGTWYLTALVVLTLTFSPLLCVVSVAVLGFADPAAAIVGRRFGRTRLSNGRSLEGTAAFWVVGTAAALGVMALLPAGPTAAIAWPVAMVAAATAAVAELLSRRIDDNFIIPLAAMAGAWATLAVLGASPW